MFPFDLFIAERNLFGIFKVVSLLSYQCSFFICCLFSRQPNHFNTSTLVCQALFLFFLLTSFLCLLTLVLCKPWFCCFVKRQRVRFYHTSFYLSSTFFKVFWFFFKPLIFTNFRIENWQKWERRKRDLNPRAALATYTLSRGASSASWVFLQFLN